MFTVIHSPSQRTMYTALLVAGAFFMEFLDGSIIATALPQMGKTFHESPVALNIGMTAYMLSLSVFIPLSGWLVDRYGARGVFTVAIAIFTLASMLCGLCDNLTEFTLARILQGFGGAMMVPVGRIAVYKDTEKEDLIRATAFLVWPALAAPILGPPLGGFITTYSSWRWIFFLNIPLGIIAMVLSQFLIDGDREDARRPFDWAGFVLSASAMTTFMYCLELIGRQTTPWGPAGWLLAYSIVAGAAAIWWFRTAPHPLIDLQAMKAKTFSVTIYGGSLFRIALSAVPFLLPLLFQLVYHLSAFAAGSLLLALFAGNLAMKSVTTFVLQRFGFRATLLVNGTIAAACMAACGLLVAFDPDMDHCHGAVRQWPLPLDAVHLPGDDRVCRCPARRCQRGVDLHEHGAATLERLRNRGRRDRAAYCRCLPRTQSRRLHHVRLHHRVRHHRPGGILRTR